MDNIFQIQDKVRKFVVSTSYIPENQINNDSLIFVQGIMDSMGFISIIDFIEENFSVAASDNELIESNFESINAISDFIFRKLS